MIIDFHTHIFPQYIQQHRGELLSRDATLADLYSSPSARMASADELVSTMDGAGIDVSVAVGIGWNDMELCRMANDYVIESVQRFPMRLKGFCSVNPRWGSDAVREMERCADAGLIGVGELHPDTQGFDLGDKAIMASLVKAAVERGMPILTHASEPVGHLYAGKGHITPDVLLRFIDNFPDATLICAHWGGGLPFYALMPEVSQSLRRVYFDTAASPFLYQPEVFPIVNRLIGDEKILLGTDYPLMPQGRVIHQIVDALISDDAKEGILYANAARLLGIRPWNE